MENDGTPYREPHERVNEGKKHYPREQRARCCEAEVTMKQLLQISSGIKANV